MYILVFNMMDTEESNRIEYWLHSIRSRARKAPIVLVGTHLDEAGVEKATTYLTKVNRFKSQHPNIKLASAISLSTVRAYTPRYALKVPLGPLAPHHAVVRHSRHSRATV